MKVDLPAGKYVVAVSGGVDSMVLFDLLAKRAEDGDIQLVVAHFDHGIRDDSVEDRKIVQEVAAQHQVPFVYDEGKLGTGTSEAKARTARYAFLRRVGEAMGADAIITAHHQDDLLETIIINLLRGTKSRGLSSLKSGQGLLRPLLPYPKSRIRDYADRHELRWREDSTNEDETYLRNYIRKRIMPRLDIASRDQLLAHSERAAGLNDAIDTLTHDYLAAQPETSELERQSFRELPVEVGREVLAAWLRQETDVTITSKLLERLVRAIDTGRNNSLTDVARGYSLKLTRNRVILQHDL